MALAAVVGTAAGEAEGVVWGWLLPVTILVVGSPVTVPSFVDVITEVIVTTIVFEDPTVLVAYTIVVR